VRFNPPAESIDAIRACLLRSEYEIKPRSDFGSRVEPGQISADARGGDAVIELAARRNIAIDFAVSVNQHWITANSFGGEQRLKQRVLVFAIAVTVLENFGSGVWLKTSNAEGETDVANVFRGKVIQPAGFFFGVDAPRVSSAALALMAGSGVARSLWSFAYHVEICCQSVKLESWTSVVLSSSFSSAWWERSGTKFFTLQR